MSLVSWGYGHLTVITMGLGTSVYRIRQRRRRQFGEVEFENVPLEVTISDIPTDIDIEERDKKIGDTDIETEVEVG